MKKPDLANLKRVIELGSTDAARDAGLVNFQVRVRILDATPQTAIAVDIILVTPEQMAELLAEQERIDKGSN